MHAVLTMSQPFSDLTSGDRLVRPRADMHFDDIGLGWPGAESADLGIGPAWSSAGDPRITLGEVRTSSPLTKQRGVLQHWVLQHSFSARFPAAHKRRTASTRRLAR